MLALVSQLETVNFICRLRIQNFQIKGQKGEKGQDGSVVFVNDTMNAAKGEKGDGANFEIKIRILIKSVILR